MILIFLRLKNTDDCLINMRTKITSFIVLLNVIIVIIEYLIPGLDILINNAGILCRANFHDVRREHAGY